MAKVFLITSHYMGVLYIQELLKAGDEIVGVVAWPDDGYWFIPPEYDVRAKAIQNYLPFYEPEPKKINSPEFVEVIRKTAPDFILSGYYSRIFHDQILAIPKYGCINIHPTGLPRFRGLSPYFSHILFGDTRNYITMHWLNPGIDSGDIIAQASVEILPDDTGFTCGHRLTEAGGLMFRENWPLARAGTAPHNKQDEATASVFNFSWALAEIKWSKTNTQIWNLTRCITRPFSGAWTLLSGYKLRVWKTRVVPHEEELPSKDALPGEVLAVTGKGLWVQCGQGQLQILDATYEDLPDAKPADRINCLGGKLKILLG
ncbi:MAG: methionyl-tRNA formyltransferase [Pelolinea sp.]|nr:methionyl-tRNA formyltransferase [Pelolinea sp.]